MTEKEEEKYFDSGFRPLLLLKMTRTAELFQIISLLNLESVSKSFPLGSLAN